MGSGSSCVTFNEWIRTVHQPDGRFAAIDLMGWNKMCLCALISDHHVCAGGGQTKSPEPSLCNLNGGPPPPQRWYISGYHCRHHCRYLLVMMVMMVRHLMRVHTMHPMAVRSRFGFPYLKVEAWGVGGSEGINNVWCVDEYMSYTCTHCTVQIKYYHPG